MVDYIYINVHQSTNKTRHFGLCSNTYIHVSYFNWCRPGRMVIGFTTLTVQSVPTTAKLVSSNPVHGEVYSIHHYVITFVSDLRQAGGLHRVLRFPPPIKLTATI
jgi:hypothetical protein